MVVVHSFFAAGWLQAGRGEKDGCRSSYSGGARPGRFRCVEQRDLGESVLLRSRRKCRGVWRFSPVATTTPLRCGGHQTLAPAAARVFVSFSLAFLSRYVCVWGGVGCRAFAAAVLWVVPSSSAVRWRRLRMLLEPGIRSAPHSQGGPSAGKLRPKASSLRTAGPGSPGGWPR